MEYLKRENKTIMKIIFICIIVISLWTDNMGIIPYKWYTEYLLGITFIALGAFYSKVIKIEKYERKVILMLIIPNLIVLIYSLCKFYFGDNIILYEGIDTRAIGIFLYLTIAIFFSYIAFKCFKEKTIDYIFIGFCINYLLCVLIQMSRGVDTVISYFLNSEVTVGNLLEAHEISLTMPLFLMYYITNFKKNYRKIILAIVIIFCSQKRIVFACVLISILYYYFIKKIKHKKYLLEFTGIGLVIICLTYVYIIKNGFLWEFLNSHWINLMGRQYIWRGIEETYTFGISFFGNGLGFTTKWLADNSYRIGFDQIIGGLHNDVLKSYIEYGFIGFCIYIYNLTVSNTKRIRKWSSEKSSMIYLILIITEIILWLTDNVANYYNFRIVFNVILFIVLYENNIEKKKETI